MSDAAISAAFQKDWAELIHQKQRAAAASGDLERYAMKTAQLAASILRAANEQHGETSLVTVRELMAEMPEKSTVHNLIDELKEALARTRILQTRVDDFLRGPGPRISDAGDSYKLL